MSEELKILLKWQLEAGIDETIGNAPVSLIEKSSELREKRMQQLTSRVEAEARPVPQPMQNTIAAQSEAKGFAEEAAPAPTFINQPPTFNPVTMPKKAAINQPHSKWVEEAKKLAAEAKTLAELKAAIESFEGLSIKKTATNTVFAEGAANAPIMLIGEAPGENEDIKGVPFCGVSGRLLDEIFRNTGYTRAENLYITNSIFWRPPGNRRPTAEEIEMCRPFVEKHIALINPKVLVLVGATATASVLETEESISKLRKASQKFYSPTLGKEFTVRCIYHPSYLLRQPSQKKTSWFDALEIKKLAESL
jgi:uracil-DNA glycosylase family 4